MGLDATFCCGRLFIFTKVSYSISLKKKFISKSTHIKKKSQIPKIYSYLLSLALRLSLLALALCFSHSFSTLFLLLNLLLAAHASCLPVLWMEAYLI